MGAREAADLASGGASVVSKAGRKTRARMPLPQISVEIAAPATVARSGNRSIGASAERTTLLSACTAAAATAECVLANSQAKPDVLALVFWREPGRVRIEVGSASRKGSWATRDLEFGARDPAIERWRTAGYTVGLLAAEALASEQPPSSGERGAASSRDQPASETRGQTGGDTDTGKDSSGAVEAAKKSAVVEGASTPDEKAPSATASEPPGAADSVQPRAAAHRDAEPYRWSLAGGGSLGQGLDSIRGGGFLRASRAFEGPFATVALAYSVDTQPSQGVSAQWFTVSAGGGYEVTTPWFVLDLRGEVVAELLATRVDDSASGRSDSQSRWVGGLCAGAELVRRIAGPVGVLVGVEATVRTNGTDVQVGDTIRTDAPVASVGALAGVRATLR
jgi:hypothetical protein